ncbi:hypothetical protein ABK040_012697 [Willaertia magna]
MNSTPSPINWENRKVSPSVASELSPLTEKEIKSFYDKYFPQGTKVVQAKCSCGFLHPYVFAPKQEGSSPTKPKVFEDKCENSTLWSGNNSFITGLNGSPNSISSPNLRNDMNISNHTPLKSNSLLSNVLSNEIKTEEKITNIMDLVKKKDEEIEELKLKTVSLSKLVRKLHEERNSALNKQKENEELSNEVKELNNLVQDLRNEGLALQENYNDTTKKFEKHSELLRTKLEEAVEEKLLFEENAQNIIANLTQEKTSLNNAVEQNKVLIESLEKDKRQLQEKLSDFLSRISDLEDDKYVLLKAAHEREKESLNRAEVEAQTTIDLCDFDLTLLKGQVSDNKNLADKLYQEASLALQEISNYSNQNSPNKSITERSMNIDEDELVNINLYISQRLQTITRIISQIRDEVIVLKQRNKELNQQVIVTNSTKEETVKYFEEQIRELETSIVQCAKDIEEKEEISNKAKELEIECDTLRKMSEQLQMQLESTRGEREGFVKLQEQTNVELENLNNELSKLNTEKERVMKIESMVKQHYDVEITKLRLEKRSLEEKLMSTLQVSNKTELSLVTQLKDSEMQKKKLEAQIREQRIEILSLKRNIKDLQVLLSSCESSIKVFQDKYRELELSKSKLRASLRKQEESFISSSSTTEKLKSQLKVKEQKVRELQQQLRQLGKSIDSSEFVKITL